MLCPAAFGTKPVAIVTGCSSDMSFGMSAAFSCSGPLAFLSLETNIGGGFVAMTCVCMFQGCVKVSVCSDVPPTDEELAELAFEGKQPPLPLGYVRVPVEDLAGLERR